MRKEDHIERIETTRQTLQGELDASKTQTERNRLGQFATPFPLAFDIVSDILRLIPSGERIRFLDPAYGTGAFYSALESAVSKEQIESALGFEIDPHYGLKALDLWSSRGVRILLEDFTKAVPPQLENEKANLVVCNPPYVRHHHLALEDKSRLSKLAKNASGIQFNGLGGLYTYFLVLSTRWMAQSGLGAWLIPSEFMDVNYGKQIKKFLLERVSLLRIHRFDPSEVQFDDALVSSAVVIFRNALPSNEAKVAFSFGGRVSNPHLIVQHSREELYKAHKWTAFPRNEEKVATSESRYKLSDLFTIKRGLATGANNFFILSRDTAAELGIPTQFLKPILPSPRHLTKNIVESDPAGIPVLEKLLFLLDCRLPEHQVRLQFPALWNYFESARKEGVRDRYLCRKRSPWYSQEQRDPALFLCTYMGRSDGPSHEPFRFILNKSKAVAANVYHLLYPKPALLAWFREWPGLEERFLESLGKISQETIIGEGRVYGGGLHKVEPRELSNVSIEPILKNLPTLLRVIEEHDSSCTPNLWTPEK